MKIELNQTIKGDIYLNVPACEDMVREVKIQFMDNDIKLTRRQKAILGRVFLTGLSNIVNKK